MVTVSELVVAIRGEGIDQTQEDLEGMEESVEESTESMSEQATALEDLSEEFAGALSVAAVGLAVAAGSLLSQVPVIGQLFDSLFAVVQAVAFQMDQVLRPVLGPISRGFFQLAGAISSLDGPLGTIVGIFGSLVAFIGTVVAPVALLLSKFGLLSGVVAKLSGALAVVKAGLVAVAGAISLPAVALGALIAGIAALIAIALTDFRGWRTKAIEIISGLVSGLLERWRGFTDNLQTVLNTLIDKAVTKFLMLKGELVKWAAGLASDAFTWGMDFVDAFVGGIETMIGRVRQAAANLAETVREYLPSSPAKVGPLSDLDQTGPALIDEFAGGIRQRSGEVSEATGGAMRSSEGDSTRLPRPRNQTTKLFIDGREAGRGTQSERFDESARRGQTF